MRIRLSLLRRARATRNSSISAMPTLARPDPGAAGAERRPSPTTSICATIRAGPHREHWYHAAGCRALAGRDARHAHPRDRVDASRAARARREPGGDDRCAGLATASPRRRRPDRPRRRRCPSASTARAIAGFAGDTLASALLANGVSLVGRSFKYHRPRGILSRRARGAERAGRAAQRRAARAQHAGDDRRALRRPRGDEPEPLAVAAPST